MMSDVYLHYLKELVTSGEVDETLVDEAVLRILKLKNDLGLFENPYKDASEEDEKNLILCDAHRAAAREAAAKTFVLLKNEIKHCRFLHRKLRVFCSQVHMWTPERFAVRGRSLQLTTI